MIRISDVSKSYGSSQVLTDISLTVHKGSVHGVLGANGSGKTTLYKCIAGIESFTGNIKLDISPLREQLFFLETTPYMIPRITGGEYIKLVCNGSGIKNPDIEGKNIFDLPLGEYAYEYSTGMKKKLAVTAMLHLERSVYILDEPFNGVDLQSNMILLQLIKKLKEKGKTILISSHILSTLKEVCDRMTMLHEGHIHRSFEKEDYDKVEECLLEVSNTALRDIAL